MDVYTIYCTFKPPLVLYIEMCMLKLKICYYFSFVYKICLSKMKKMKIVPVQEQLFCESEARNMVCHHFWQTDHKHKTRIKTSFHINIHFWIDKTRVGAQLSIQYYIDPYGLHIQFNIQFNSSFIINNPTYSGESYIEYLTCSKKAVIKI